MSNTLVPDPHNISRFCDGREIGESGRITGRAFQPREARDLVNGKYGLSVNWLEYLELPNREAEIKEIRKVYKDKFNRGFDEGKIAILNVGNMRELIANESPDSRNIVIEHFPTPKDPSHSRIIDNLKLDDQLIFELIADCIDEEHSTNPSEST